MELMPTRSLLHPQALQRARRCLAGAASDWDSLSGITGNGPLADLEQALLDFAGGRHCLALSNCTSALLVALLAAGVGRDDEVILPAFSTWPGTLSPVLLLGARPVFADIGAGSVTLDPRAVGRLVTRRTKAIIAVHLYGLPADMEALRKVAKIRGCVLIADAAQGLGASIRGQPVGWWGDMVALSFGRSKLVSAGEGGALLCNDDRLYERALACCQHPVRMHRQIDDGVLRRSVNRLAPLNLRMHPLVASLAHGQLEGVKAAGVVEKGRRRYLTIRELLEGAGMGRLVPKIPKGSIPSGQSFPLLDADLGTRKGLEELCRSRGLALTEGGVHTPLDQAEVLSSDGPKPLNPREEQANRLRFTRKRLAAPQLFVQL